MLLRLPLKPLVPALAQHSVSPLVSVIVTVVLLNVALHVGDRQRDVAAGFARLLLPIGRCLSLFDLSLLPLFVVADRLAG